MATTGGPTNKVNVRIIHVCVEARLGMMRSVSRFSKPMDPETFLMKPDLNPVNLIAVAPRCSGAIPKRYSAGLPDFFRLL